jgi:HAD superfamily hydrolase (TIGR01490 family)
MPIASKPSVLVPDGECGCGPFAHLPEGVCRVAPAALGAERLIPPEPARNEAGKVQVAAFDFDGTCIRGNSPVLLVRHLARRRMLKPSVVARILGWAACYKARLPQNESWVRGLVFRAFAGISAAEVNRFLCEFYDEYIDERFRPEAERAMADHEAAGHAVLVVSATFEPIIAAAMQRHPIQYAIATRMRVDGRGNYTDQVASLPVEGPQKVQALRKVCDELFGEDGWELAWAYGDHHSDRAGRGQGGLRGHARSSADAYGQCRGLCDPRLGVGGEVA